MNHALVTRKRRVDNSEADASELLENPENPQY